MVTQQESIALPGKFLHRHCDLIAQGLGVTVEEMLRVWLYFASAGNDRLEKKDVTLVVMEKFIQGQEGVIDRLVQAGFLREVTGVDECQWLMCVDFFPINQHLREGWVHNQALGYVGRVLAKEERAAKKGAVEQMKLLEEKEGSVIKDIPATPAQKEAAVALIRNIYSLIKGEFPGSGGNAIIEHNMLKAIQVVKKLTDKELADKKKFLFAEKDKASSPQDVEGWFDIFLKD